ncbi:restriction endonuclease subunit S [Maribacter flavus]|uniref:Restriction endonuclease subunit S n=1 Tax=Maribacter flavus TaxID=1658664 RepID=A0A5B2TMM8_9FLAO|nr:restriction endonuclease subunit S [Maribacter flavus]KAA2215742.1 restriction endonuclease subunit S [Maribacter flavus]
MKLSKLARIVSGLNQKRHPQGTVYYLQARDFMQDDMLDKNLKPTILDYPKLESHYLSKGDVLVLAKGHHGFNAFLYHEEKSPAVASSIFLVLRHVAKKVLPEYLVWFINLESTQLQLINSGRGSALPAINKGILADLEVPVPDLQVQSDIVTLSRLKAEETRLANKLDLLKLRELEIKLKERIQ